MLAFCNETTKENMPKIVQLFLPRIPICFLHKNETHFGNFSPLCDEYNSDNITDRAS